MASISFINNNLKLKRKLDTTVIQIINSEKGITITLGELPDDPISLGKLSAEVLGIKLGSPVSIETLTNPVNAFVIKTSDDIVETEVPGEPAVETEQPPVKSQGSSPAHGQTFSNELK